MTRHEKANKKNTVPEQTSAKMKAAQANFERIMVTITPFVASKPMRKADAAVQWVDMTAKFR